MKIFENCILTNDHLEQTNLCLKRVVRQPYTAVDPNERAVAYKFS